MKDYYKILGVDMSASQVEIEMAYRKLSFKFNPEKNGEDPFFENLFNQVQEAYEVLGNEQRRLEYDSGAVLEDERKQKSTQQDSLMPGIHLFQADKSFFYDGDVIRFEWETTNAEIVRIKPFGLVEPVGAKSFKLRNCSKEALIITIEATNLSTDRTVVQSIELFNKSLDDSGSIENLITENSAYSSDGQEEEKFFSIKGRLRRNSFVPRAILLFVTAVLLYLFSENAAEPSTVILSYCAIAACGILFLMQSVKRLHDTNYSSWWLFSIFFPLLTILFLLHAFFIDGTPGPNKYGNDPKLRLSIR